MPISLDRVERMTVLVPDAERAASYLGRILGIPRVDDWPSPLTGEGSLKLTHVAAGDTVLEFVQPLLETGDFAETLRRDGASIRSIAFAVDDPSAASREAGDHGIDASNDAYGRLMLRTRHRTGFDVELVPAEHSADRSVRGGRVSPMIQVEITLPDMEAATDLLRSLFAASPVEETFCAFLNEVTAGRMKLHHMMLGNAMLQLVRPREDAGPWYDLLQEIGPSVHNLSWLVDDMPAIAEASAREGTSDLRYFEFDYSPLVGAENLCKPVIVGRIIDARHILGFHAELSERQSTNISEFICKADYPQAI